MSVSNWSQFDDAINNWLYDDSYIRIIESENHLSFQILLSLRKWYTEDYLYWHLALKWKTDTNHLLDYSKTQTLICCYITEKKFIAWNIGIAKHILHCTHFLRATLNFIIKWVKIVRCVIRKWLWKCFCIITEDNVLLARLKFSKQFENILQTRASAEFVWQCGKCVFNAITFTVHDAGSYENSCWWCCIINTIVGQRCYWIGSWAIGWFANQLLWILYHFFGFVLITVNFEHMNRWSICCQSWTLTMSTSIVEMKCSMIAFGVSSIILTDLKRNVSKNKYNSLETVDVLGLGTYIGVWVKASLLKSFLATIT